ncbi:oocyte zinc finger protein XlCOF6-like [Chironomus tepperi]|uniref:oocyte zinc finger protein XlCOF6-like n=1 Tax=Chironomus tepperi TaxID=113505 RepID=UPI00391F8819
MWITSRIITKLSIRIYHLNASTAFRRFSKQRDYTVHVSSKHTKFRKWLCDLCGGKFAEKYQLRRHFQSHLNAKGITVADIPQYNEIFNEKSRSRSQKSSKKSIDKKFACNLCGKKFAARTLLKTHLDRHQKRKENYCNICKVYDDNIKEHYETEHKDLEYSCKICFKKFARGTQLRNHHSANHIEHTCDICGKIFFNLTTIKLHIDMVHADPDIDMVKEEPSDDDYNYVDQGNDYENRSDHSEIDIKPKDIEQVNVDSIPIDIKKEPKVLYDESFYETEMTIKNEQISEPEDADTYDTEIADNVKVEEITIEPDQIEDTQTFKDKDDLEFKCNVCESLHATKETFREHFMSDHAEEKDELFTCIACDKTYKTKELIFLHARRIHRKLKNEPIKVRPDPEEQPSIMCSYCGKIFRSQVTLNRHVQAMHCEKRIPCPVCGKKFSFLTEMNKHRDRNHDKKRKHKCSKCPQQFVTKYELKLHLEHNHNLNRENTFPEFMCYCGVSCKSQSVLARHKRMVHGDKDPDIIRECEICKEVLKDLYLKRKHMAQVHLNGKKLKRTCGYCNTEFELYEDFKAHIESHAELFICITCGEFFFDAETLASHQSTHRTVDINLRKFECDHCGHRTFLKIQLQMHMIKHLKDCAIHYCDICGKGFKFASSLYTHRKFHGEGEFACTQCDRKFVRNHELVVHIRTHTNEKPFRCQVCGRGFSIKILLQNHLQSHPETRVMFQCKGCNNAFTDKKQLNMHEDLVHPELRPYRCDMCCMSFRYEHNLRKHNTHKHL